MPPKAPSALVALIEAARLVDDAKRALKTGEEAPAVSAYLARLESGTAEVRALLKKT